MQERYHMIIFVCLLLSLYLNTIHLTGNDPELLIWDSLSDQELPLALNYLGTSNETAQIKQQLFGEFSINYNYRVRTTYGISNYTSFITPESPSNTNSSLPVDIVNSPTNFSASYNLTHNVKLINIGGLFGVSQENINTVDEAGLQFIEAFRLSIRSLNGKSNYSDYRRYVYEIMDTENTPKIATNAVYILLQQNTSALVGLGTISEVIGVRPLLTNSNFTLVSGAATSTFLSNAESFPFFYRTIPDDFYVATALTQLMRLFGWTLVTALYTDDDIGSSGASAFPIAAQNSGITITCSTTIVSGTIEGINNFSNCFASTPNVEVIVLWMAKEDASNAMRVISKNPSNKFAVYIAPPQWTDIQSFKVFSLNTFPPSTIKGSIGVLPRTGDVTAFRKFFTSLSPSNTLDPVFLSYWEDKFQCSLAGSPFINQYFHTIGIDNITFNKAGTLSIPFIDLNILSTLRNLNSSFLLSPNAIVQSAHVNNDTDSIDIILRPSNPFSQFQTPLLPLCSTDMNQRSPNKTCRCNLGDKILLATPAYDYRVNYIYDAVTVVGNALDKILYESCVNTGVCLDVVVNTSSLIQAISETDFIGLTGRIQFSGHDRKDAILDFYQFNDDGNLRHIGFYNNSTVFINESLIEFKTPTVPISMVIPDSISLSYGIAIVVVIISGLIIITSIGFMIYFTKHKESPVVKQTTWLFLLIFHIGVISVCIMLIIWSFNQTQVTCITKFYWGLFGYSIILGAFIAKIYRAFLLLMNRPLYTPYVSAKLMIFCCFLITAINFTMFTFYAFITGPLDAVVVQSSTDILYKYVQCRIPNLTFQLVIVIIIFTFNGVVTLICAIIAFFVRNVKSSFEEIKYISLSLDDFIVLSAVLYPLYYASNDGFNSAEREYTLRSLVTLFMTLFSLCIISMPKIAYIWSGEDLDDSGSFVDSSENYSVPESLDLSSLNTAATSTDIGSSDTSPRLHDSLTAISTEPESSISTSYV